MGRHALLLGGTGFIGKEVFATLLSQAQSLGFDDITLVSRRSNLAASGAPGTPPGPLHRAVRLHALRWDVVCDAPESHQAQLATVTDVFYAVQFPGHPVEDPSKGRTYLRFDLGGLENLLCALGQNKGTPRRIIYLSGAGAGQGRLEPWFVAKDRAETMLAEYARMTGGSYFAVRPSLVFGEGDVSLNRFVGMARFWRMVPLFGRGDTLLQPLWVKDLARLIVQMGFGGTALGAFDLPGPQKVTFRELLALRLAADGLKAHFVETPMPLVQLGAHILGKLPGQVLNPNAVRFLTQSVPLELPAKPDDVASLFQDFLKQCKTPAEAFTQYKKASPV